MTHRGHLQDMPAHMSWLKHSCYGTVGTLTTTRYIDKLLLIHLKRSLEKLLQLIQILSRSSYSHELHLFQVAIGNVLKAFKYEYQCVHVMNTNVIREPSGLLSSLSSFYNQHCYASISYHLSLFLRRYQIIILQQVFHLIFPFSTVIKILCSITESSRRKQTTLM